MTMQPDVKKQIYQIIEATPVEQLPELLRFLKQFLQHTPSDVPANAAPIYQIHERAVDTGVSDLAAQHDHYLYGASKNDA